MLLSERVPPEITILTPTWNRRHLLPRLYQSLVAQEAIHRSFEWLVVDDGSTDGTTDWLESIIADAPFPITLLRKDNGGKYTALNMAADHANGLWQIIIDSDDVLLPKALATIQQAIAIYATPKVAMIATLFDISGRPTPNFEVPRNPCRYFEWVDYQGQFDFLPILRSSVARDIKFPERAGEPYFPESWRYYKISEEFECYFLNEILAEAVYHVDGLSSNSLLLRIKSPINVQDANIEAFKSSRNILFRLRKAINSMRFGLHGNIDFYASRKLPAHYRILLPVSYFIYLIDKIRTSG